MLKIQPLIVPPLDEAFLPASLFHKRYRELAAGTEARPLQFALEKPDGSISSYSTRILAPGNESSHLNLVYAERILKFLLWQKGGWKIQVNGPFEIINHLRDQYRPGGIRQFDWKFMSDLYEKPFTILPSSPGDFPEPKEPTLPLGGHLDGCRVGFDLGASDRKASAVIEGEAVYSEEVPWDPRNEPDPDYHYHHIMDSIRRAAEKLPRLDAVGGSSAGIYLHNRVRAASLFRSIPKKLFEEKIAGLFLRIRDELGVPLEVVNDGEVTALAGSMSIGDNPVLGIAMGSSEAAGYITPGGHITSWLNELAFAPIDYRRGYPVDEWSGDAGCGAQYFSQMGAIRLAGMAGIKFEEDRPLPEKLVELQDRMKAGDEQADKVYATIGICLGYAVAHYAEFYQLKHILLLGRVTTGPGGEIIARRAADVLKAEFPELAEKIILSLPDESNRRVRQAIAAASLPEIKRGAE